MKPVKHLLFTCLGAALLFASTVRAAIPSPERLLPDDTLVMITAPDFGRLSDLSKKSPQLQLWNDPAMRPFKDKFMAKWNEELVQPLERELNVKLADYTALFQGQVTIALIQNGWKGQDGQDPGFLLLVDAKEKSDELKKNLADLKKKLTNSGRTLKTEKIRDLDFFVLPLSSNDVPKTIRKFFPKSSEVQEVGDDKPETKASEKGALIVGQAGSLLVLANSLKAAETVVARVGGGSIPTLGDFGPYQQNHLAMFRDSPLYGWVNIKRFMDILVPVWSEKKENPDAPNPFDIKPEKILNALGVSALKTMAFNFRESTEGSMFELTFSVPEASRQGIFKILAGEPKESTPPPFIPADAMKFQRYRIDGKKAWASLEKALGDISPQAVGALNFMLDSANTYAKEKDPGFDIRKNLIGNLGDDIITVEKRPPTVTAGAPASGPSLVLLGSPNPEQFTAALKSILVFMSQQAGTPPQEREFLGRKIMSVPISIPGRPAPASGKTPNLHYSSSNGYVALSSDASMVEEFLRTCDSPPKPLRDVPGLSEAAQKVTGPNSSLFGYENDVETMRMTFEWLRKNFASDKSSSLGGLSPISVALGDSEKIFKEWLDFSLLPSYDKISKYFSFSVYGGSATVDGLTLKMFSPVPPGLK